MTNLRSLSFDEKAYPFISTGTINYSPIREKTKFSDERICVIDTDEELSSFYRKMWISKLPHKPILKPSWPAHISIMRGTRIVDESKEWKHRDGETITFHYNPELGFNAEHLWINVYAKTFFELREYYDIPVKENYGHITIAKFK